MFLPEMNNKLITAFIQIFSIGKSLNFIRYSCHDSDWVVTNGKAKGADKSDYSYFF